jgi:hypothetical protein
MNRLPKLTPTGVPYGEFTDTHIAHYKDWTIVVVFDSMDFDWMAQASRRICDTIEEYVAAVQQDPYSILYATPRKEPWRTS